MTPEVERYSLYADDAYGLSLVHEAAFACPPLVRAEGKRPLLADWPRAVYAEPERVRNELRGWRGNVVMVMGARVGDALFNLAVDVDVRTIGWENSIEALVDDGLNRRTATVLTGGGGQHYFYVTDRAVHKGALMPGVDLQGIDSVVVVPPSVHPFTGNAYEWEAGWCALVDDPPIKLDDNLAARWAAGSSTRREVTATDAEIDEACVLLTALGAHTFIEHTPEGWVSCTRPGKQGGESATIGKLGAPSSVYVWSTNWPGLPSGPHDLRELRKLAGVPSIESRLMAHVRPASPEVVAELEPPPELPVPLDIDTAPLPVFPVEVLPEWVGEFATQLAHAMQTPVDLPAMIIVAALAAASGGRVIAVPRSGWEEPTNLFVAVAMPPASRKSPVFRMVTEPLRLAERTLVDQTRESISASRVEKQAAEQRAKQLLNESARLTGEDASNKRDEASAAQLIADAINVPTLPRILASDATPEALISLLANYGGRIAVMSAEGGVFDQIAGRYTGKPALDVYLNGHAGDSLHVDRIGRPPEYIERPALTIGMTTQPTTFRALARINADIKGRGLVGRFLWALPPSNIGKRDATPDPVDAEVYERYITRMVALTESLANWESDPYRLTFSVPAQVRITEYLREVERQLDDGGDLEHVHEWGGKLVGHVVRLAALLHLAHHEGERWRSSVEVERVEAAITIGTYLKAHALRTFRYMSTDTAHEGAQAVLTWARAQVAPWSARDAHRALQGRGMNAKQIHEAVELLIEHGEVDAVEPPARQGPGRKPPTRYRAAGNQEREQDTLTY